MSDSARALTVTAVVPAANEGGSGEILLNVLRHAHSAQMTLDVVSLDKGPLNARIDGLGAPLRVVNGGRLRDPVALGRVWGLLARHFRVRRPDVALSWEAGAHPWVAPASTAAGVPVVFHQAGHPSRRVAVDVAATALPSRGVIVASNFIAGEQARLWPRRNVAVVPYGIDLARFDAAADRRDGALADPVVAMVGRLSRWKRQHVFVEAAADVLRQLPGARFVLVGGEASGDHGYEAELRAQASALGLTEPRLTFAGAVRDVERYYANADIVVHLSDHEPFGLVLLEAMAAGAMLISVREGAPLEIVEDGVTGRLLKAPTAKVLSETIVKLSGDGPQRLRLARAGHRYAIENGSALAMTQRFASALRQLLDVDG